MSRRQFDAYTAERRLVDAVERNALRAIVLALKARRAWVLGSGAVGDVARRVGRRPA